MKTAHNTSVHKNKIRRVIKHNFVKWWSVNHHRKPSHTWLCRNARRVSYAYNLEPAAFEDVQYITKRFYASEWPRLSSKEAWKLWKLCHPTITERNERLLSTAEYLDKVKTDGKQSPIRLGEEKPTDVHS